MPEAVPKPLNIPLRGMSCASCVNRIEKAISTVPGVRRASVNLAAERAQVEGGDPAAVAAAIRGAGYEPDLPPEKWTGLSRSALGLGRADVAQG